MAEIQSSGDSFDELTEFMLAQNKVAELENLSKEIDAEIKNSRKIFEEARNMYDNALMSVLCSETKHEDLSNFLKAPSPNLLLPDMCINLKDLDLNESISKIEEYIEKIKSSITTLEEQGNVVASKEMQPIDFEQCSVSLQQMVKRVAGILNLSTNEKLKCNTEFEEKFSVLCKNVEDFTKMVEAQTNLANSSTNWSKKVAENVQISYEEIFSKLLGSIYELAFLVEKVNDHTSDQ